MPSVWSVPANGDAEVVETYGFMTDVLESYAGLEQRIQLREIPLEAFEFDVLADGREARLLRALVEVAHDAALAVPLWQYGSLLTGDVAIGESLLPIVDAEVVPYRRSVDNGGYVLVWRDPWTWELLSVDSTGPGGVTTIETAGAAWGAGSAYVYPARLARLGRSTALRWLSTRVVAGRVQFSVEPI